MMTIIMIAMPIVIVIVIVTRKRSTVAIVSDSTASTDTSGFYPPNEVVSLISDIDNSIRTICC